ncbi:hypothetical protein [Leifsonia sp. Leaf264]|uniref:hypothetical protein n=1 Tax=Leifsonia sp. Leaf264 TaxID=1736314 RepID=UPI0007011F41|nr:hypothetical protein [Leifsonia sp. Leaf264]KQO98205.1 hypothetical protein ASF30_09090 [Leifsonia sp. Leaf264]
MSFEDPHGQMQQSQMLQMQAASAHQPRSIWSDYLIRQNTFWWMVNAWIVVVVAAFVFWGMPIVSETIHFAPRQIATFAGKADTVLYAWVLPTVAALTLARGVSLWEGLTTELVDRSVVIRRLIWVLGVVGLWFVLHLLGATIDGFVAGFLHAAIG